MLCDFGVTVPGSQQAIEAGCNQHCFVLGFLHIRQNETNHVLADLSQQRYKLRPKFHAFHCQIVLHASSGAKLNVRFGSCFNEEDLIGKLTRVTKGALHASSSAKRLLQRWLLQMNAHLCEGKDR